MLVDLTAAQLRALCSICLEALTTPGRPWVHIDVVEQVETTPEDLLVLFMDVLAPGRMLTTDFQTARANLRATQIEHLRADVAAGGGHNCDEWVKDGKCRLCDREVPA